MCTYSENDSIKTLTATMEWNCTQRNTDEGMPVQFRQTITALIETLIKPNRLKRDLFFVVLLLFMKENGFFQLKDEDEGNTTIIDYILSRKDKGTIYEVVFILNGFTDTPLKVIGVPISDAVLVNAVIPDADNKAFSLCFDVNRYVAMSTLGLVSHFTNHQELSHLFMDNIVTPLKCAILNYHGYPSCSLSGLPEHLISHILLYLPVRSVLNIGECCKCLKDIVSDERLWRRLYERDFTEFVERKNDEKDWRDSYVELYLIKRAESEGARWVVSNREFSETFDDMNSPSLRWQLIL